MHESGNSLVKIISDQCYITVTICKESKKEDYYLYHVKRDAPGEIFELRLNRRWKPTTEANFEQARLELYQYQFAVQEAIAKAIKNKTPF